MSSTDSFRNNLLTGVVFGSILIGGAYLLFTSDPITCEVENYTVAECNSMGHSRTPGATPWILAIGAGSFFALLFMTDTFHFEQLDKVDEKTKKILMLIALAVALAVFGYLLYIVIFQGGMVTRWFG